jgi:thiol-disulfide isomerase/thioredoxin
MHILNNTIKRCLILALTVSSLLCSNSFATENSKENTSNEKGFFALSLKSLQKPETVPFAQYKNRQILLSFFEPECSWCYRQILALDKLQKKCGNNIQVILMGIHGTRQELQRDLRRAKTNLPAYEANQALLNFTGDIDATPMTFIINTHGTITHKVRGYSPNLFTDNALCSQPIAQLL